MNTSEKLKTIADNVERVYGAGVAAAEKKCREEHFCAVIKGDGTGALSFDLSFEPDVLYIFTNDPDIRLFRSIVAYIELDFLALGQLAGKRGGTGGNGDTYVNLLNLPASSNSMYRKENETVTISNVNITTSTNNLGLCSFAAGVNYLVLASKLDMPALKTRIEESVARLPDTACTAYYQTAKVNKAFTSDEWSTLMSTKPNCTFMML